MSINKLKIRSAKSEIIKILTEKAPDSVRVMRLYEMFNKRGYGTEVVDAAVEELMRSEKIKRSNPLQQTGQKLPPGVPEGVMVEYENRESIQLVSYGDIPVDGSRSVGEGSTVVKFLPYTPLSSSELNEVVDVLVDEINDLNDSFDKRIQKEISKIYRQMIGIFGVFVSIFSIIIISTEKMLRFEPEVLQQDWWELLYKSSALFIPVLVTVGGLVWVVMRRSKR